MATGHSRPGSTPTADDFEFGTLAIPLTFTSTSILYSSPSYSRIMSHRHCGCRGLLVGKRVQEV